jgi:hypothetical protein
MTSDRESPAPESGDRGVFGNLPSERPGVRSPRRGEGKGSKPKAKAASASRAKATPGAAKPASKAPPKAAPKAPPPPRPAPPPPRAPEAEEPASGRGSVEEVAWAGITVAAEAATLGVRLFSRALEAVRERR